jgi:hypothetical protein
MVTRSPARVTAGSRDWTCTHSRSCDGVWLRAPYLHNGAVPTLRDLLRPPKDRPTTFYRGYDVYHWKDVGFVSDVPEEKGRKFSLFDGIAALSWGTYSALVGFIGGAAFEDDPFKGLALGLGLALTVTGASPIRVRDQTYIAVGAGQLGGLIPYVVIIAAAVVAAPAEVTA